MAGHWVKRYDWGRSSSFSAYYTNKLANLNANSSFTSGFIKPNAMCPVCGELVFYYQNKHGSRVYFDELGPPWPKHECMDNTDSISSPRTAKKIVLRYPTLRSANDCLEIASCRSHIYHDPEFEFAKRYRSKPWTCCKVEKRIESAGTTFLILTSVEKNRRFMYLEAKKIPASVVADEIIFYNRGVVEYFDFQKLKQLEFQVTRLSSAIAFVRRLVCQTD